LILDLLIYVALSAGAVGVVSYFLYAHSRMNENNEKEKFYKNVSDYALLLLCALGIVIMIIYAETSE